METTKGFQGDSPCKCSFGTGYNFSWQNEASGWDSSRIDILELSIEHCLFQHAQKYNSSDPELNPEQISPVLGADDQPDQAHGDVDAAHDPVEGQQGVVYDAQVPVFACRKINELLEGNIF